MDFKDLTFVTCSYNQKEVLEYALKSLCFYHPDVKFNLLVMENSKENSIRKWLAENKIPFFDNCGGDTRHSPSMDMGLKLIKTKYAVMMDTDILFLKPITKLLQVFENNELTIGGEFQESRGGYELYPRISPHFALINLENINFHKINFHDQKRIDSTESNGFFGNIPLQINKGKKYYDCGSTFLEDIKKAGLKVANFNGLKDYVYTCESLSWAEQSGVEGYINLGKQRKKEFFEKAEKYKDTNLKNRFEKHVRQ